MSAISAISVSPRRRRAALYARFHRDKNVRSAEVVQFLQQLLRHLRGPVVLLWDSGRQHRSALVQHFLQAHPRLHTYRFPGYAPDLNPDEFVWNHLKRAVANSVPSDLVGAQAAASSPAPAAPAVPDAALLVHPCVRSAVDVSFLLLMRNSIAAGGQQWGERIISLERLD